MIPPGTPEHEVEGLLFWAYNRAKSAWRHFTHKPVRRVRRFYRRKGKGKGKGMGRRNGKGAAAAFITESNDEELEAFFGKGKKGHRSS